MRLIKLGVPVCDLNYGYIFKDTRNMFLNRLASQSGNVGVVHLLENDKDLDWLIDVGPNPPYVVMMQPNFFRRYNKPTTLFYFFNVMDHFNH